jgi:CheY-like chemotaxis protein
MNVLVFDDARGVASVVKSLLLARGHRVAVASDPEEAARMLATSLIDVLVFGPTGAPEEFAAFVQDEFPQLPVVLAGVPVAVPADGPVAAVLPAPLSARRLLSAFARLERDRAERLRSLPVVVAADGVSIACRLADLTPETMLICGESDEFHRHFDDAPARLEATVAGTAVHGAVTSSAIEGPLRLRRVAVKIEGEGAREVLAALLRQA